MVETTSGGLLSKKYTRSVSGRRSLPCTLMWSLDSSALLPSSVMVWPFTVTSPDLISSSAWRREAMPARAIIFCSRSSMGRRLAPWCRYSLTEKRVWSEWEAWAGAKDYRRDAENAEKPTAKAGGPAQRDRRYNVKTDCNGWPVR